MKITKEIEDLILLHDLDWFNDMKEEFISHKDFDKEDWVIKFEIESETEEFITDELEELVTNEIEFQIRVHNCEMKFSEYCWHPERIPGNKSKIFDLSKTLDKILTSLEQIIKQEELHRKHEIIIGFRDTLIENVCLLQENKNFEYSQILNTFLLRARQGLTERFGTIKYVLTNHPSLFGPLHSTQENGPALSGEADLSKIKLTLNFFNLLFEQHDADQYPIVIREEMKLGKTYASFLYSIYKGKTYTAKPEINFNWEARKICYLLSQITKTQTKLRLTDLERLSCLKINGVPFNSRNCRKSTHDFKKKYSAIQIASQISTELLNHFN